MRVIVNEKFLPVEREDGTMYGYQSCIKVDVEGYVFEAIRTMPVPEYEQTFPVLRDFIHDSLRTDIMTQIRKKLFEGMV